MSRLISHDSSTFGRALRVGLLVGMFLALAANASEKKDAAPEAPKKDGAKSKAKDAKAGGPYVLKNPPGEKKNASRSVANNDLIYLKARKSALDGNYRQAASYFEQALKNDPESDEIMSQLGELYLKMGEHERAVELGRKAVELRPDNPAYHMTLASTYAALKQYSEARTHYRKALELNPQDRKLPLLVGIVEAELGNLDESLKVFSAYIKDNPDSETGYFYRARIYLEKEDIERAKKDLDAALTIRPSFEEAGVTLGMLYEKLGDSEAAIRTYRRIDGGGQYLKRLSQLYLQDKKYEEALKALTQYEEIEPDDYTAKVKVGLIHFELKDYKSAIKKFEAILKSEPSSDNVRFYLAAVHEEAKSFDKAIAEYKKISKDSSFFTQSVLHVGFLLRDQGKIPEGIRYAKDVVDKHPEVPEFYDMYAAFYEHQKNYPTALKIIQRGIRKHPDNEKLLYFEGAMFDKLGQRDKSMTNMRKILEINANNPHALNFLGYSFAERGENLDEAEQLILRALKIRPNDGFIEDSLGWVLFKKGKVNEALDRLQKASTLQPDEAVIFDHLGDVFVHRKEYKKALEMYERAAKLSKDKDSDLNQKVKEKLAKLEESERQPSNKK